MVRRVVGRLCAEGRWDVAPREARFLACTEAVKGVGVRLAGDLLAYGGRALWRGSPNGGRFCLLEACPPGCGDYSSVGPVDYVYMRLRQVPG